MQVVPVLVLATPLLLLLVHNPALEELDSEFANSNQSKRKGPVPMSRDQLLSATLSNRRLSMAMDLTVASWGLKVMVPRREGLEE